MTDTGGNQREINLLIDAFILSEKLQDQSFKDAVIDSLVHAVDTPDGQNIRWYPKSAAVDRAYSGTPEKSPLRKLLVDMHFFHGHADWLDEPISADFLKDLAKDFLHDREGIVTRTDRTRTQLAGCSYHSHGAKNTCYTGAT